MKNPFKSIIFVVLVSSCACTKESQTEPCLGQNTTCFHTIINEWKLCPDPNNPEVKIVQSYSGVTTVDTLSTCDTLNWLNEARKFDQEWLTYGDSTIKELKRKYPNTCGCN